MQPVLEGADQALEAINSFRDKPAGLLRLTVVRPPAMTLMAPLVPLFLAEYPAIQLEIAIEDGRIDIVTERFDAGIRLDGRIEKDFITKRFFRGFDVLAVATPDYLARTPRLKMPQDLQAHNCIRQRQPFDKSLQPWVFHKQREKLAVDVDGGFIVNDLHFALSAVLSGMGIGYFPEPLIVHYLSEGQLVPVFKDWAGRTEGLLLFYSSRRQIPMPLKAFMEFIEKNRELIGTLRPIRYA
jgi:DNA-binding transcriptional LysR family regulator